MASNSQVEAKKLALKYTDPTTSASERLEVVAQLNKSPTLTGYAILYLSTDYKEHAAKEILKLMQLPSLKPTPTPKHPNAPTVDEMTVILAEMGALS